MSGVNDIELQPSSPTRIHRKIYLYILRNTTVEEKFKIRINFHNDIRYNFNRIDTFDEKMATSPYIYRVDLDLFIDNQNRLFINYQNTLVPIKDYRLYLSRKIFKSDSTFRDYHDDKDRYIDNPHSITHYFLFDVNFSKNLVDSPPGKNLFCKIKIKLIFL
jgi:hypothetical protein